MTYSHVFRTIESHTGGNPTRTVVSGIPLIPGRTVMDKAVYFEQHLDHLRQTLMYEPRGHGVMSGCILTEACHEEADLGVIYIEVGGYLPMCGHDTIGLVTVLGETGQVPLVEPRTPIVLDTPAGLVRTTAHVRNGRVIRVTFLNVPSFVLAADVEISLPDIGPVSVDIAWGGNFYGILDARAVGLALVPEEATRAIALARVVRAAVDRSLAIVHPLYSHVRGLTHVEFSGPPTTVGADIKNMVVIPPGGVDRSPCGTGTSAKAAVLHRQGKLATGQTFTHESVTGALFTATVRDTATVGAYPAVTVEIGGSAHIYGESTLVLDEHDSLSCGFLVP